MRRLVGGFSPYLLLTALCLALYLPGIASLPPLDRDESRFAQASHQMLETGDYVRIRFQEESRAKKPVGVYWLQAAAAEISGAETAIWAYRVPSVLGALAAVLLTFHFGSALVGRPGALIGAALLGSSLLLVAEAHQAKTDAVLLATLVAAQGVLARYYLAGKGAAAQPGLWLCFLFWVAQGLGILVKGPIVPVVSLLTILVLWAWERRISWLKGIRPVAGLLVAAAIVAPWAAAISAATDGQFIGEAVKSDLLPKLIGGQESHGAPPGYYLALATITLWPGAMFAVPALLSALGRRHAASLRFLIAWAVPAWIMFEAVPTKLPHYVLVAYPALALMAGVAVAAGDSLFSNRFVRLYQVVAALIGPILGGAMIFASLRFGAGLSVPVVLVAVLAAFSGLAPLWFVFKGDPARAVGAAVVGALLTVAGLTEVAGPRLDALWISRAVDRAVPAGVPVAASGYHEPSLVFLRGTDTRLVDGANAARFLTEVPGGVAVVESAQEGAFLAALEGRSPERFATVQGWNYSRGRAATLGLWRLP